MWERMARITSEPRVGIRAKPHCVVLPSGLPDCGTAFNILLFMLTMLFFLFISHCCFSLWLYDFYIANPTFVQLFICSLQVLQLSWPQLTAWSHTISLWLPESPMLKVPWTDTESQAALALNPGALNPEDWTQRTEPSSIEPTEHWTHGALNPHRIEPRGLNPEHWTPGLNPEHWTQSITKYIFLIL